MKDKRRMDKEKFDFKKVANEIKKKRGFSKLINSELCEKEEKKIAEECCYTQKDFEIFLNLALDNLEKKLKEEKDRIEYIYYRVLLDVFFDIVVSPPRSREHEYFRRLNDSIEQNNK